MSQVRRIEELDDQLWRIQQSSRTTLPAMVPIHDWLRMRLPLYYQWHLFPYAKIVHILILILAIVTASSYLYQSVRFPEPVQAATTLDMATTSNWNLRIDGVTGDFIAQETVTTTDLDGDGKLDFVVGAVSGDNNSRSSSGSVYIIYGSLLDDYTGTGNTIDLADSSKWNIRIDGAAANIFFGEGGATTGDFDNGGRTVNSDIPVCAIGKVNGIARASVIIE